MSTADEIGLCGAKRRLESVATTARERLERARRLSSVADRKRQAGNRPAVQDRLAAVRRILGEAESALAAAVPYRDRIHEHVRAHPQIEGGIYDGTVRTFEDLRRTVAERRRRAAMDLAVTRHRADLAAPSPSTDSAWEDAFDAVRDALHLLTHIRRHDLPALVQDVAERDTHDGSHRPTAGLAARLSLAREYRERIAALDHEAIARAAASVNSELGVEYRSMVERFRTKEADLEDHLAAVAAFLAGRVSGDEVLDVLGGEEESALPSGR